jgi:hypothetical protein
MANIKITDLTAYTDAASTDVLPIVDVGADVTKKITIGNVVKAVPLGTAALPGLAFDGDPNTGIYSPGADQVAISTNGERRLFVDASGNVGVGTASPSKPLHISSADDTPLLVEHSDGVSAFIQIKNTGGSASVSSSNNDLRFLPGEVEKLRITSTGTLMHLGAGNSTTPAVQFNGSAPVNSLVMDSSGRVGLGTSSPSTTLEVNGTATVDRITNPTTGSSDPWLKGVNGSGTETSFIKTDGQGYLTKLGIGTASPSHPLVVKESSNVCIELLKSNDASILTIGEDGSGSAVFNAPNGSCIFQEGGSEAARIDTSGTFRVKGAGTAGVTDAVQLNGSAPANSLLLDASGRVLVGTSSVLVDNTSVKIQATASGGGQIALGRNDTEVNADNLIGGITFHGNDSNGTYEECAHILARADGTHGDGDKPTRLVFSTTAASASSPTEHMRIDSNGAVEIFANIRPRTDNVTSLGTAGKRWSVVYAATGSINTSDATLKQDIEELDAAELSVATAIKGLIKKFRFTDAVSNKGDDARIHVGVIAQEVEQAFVAAGLDPRRYGMFCEDTLEDGTKRLGIRYDELLAFVIAAL